MADSQSSRQSPEAGAEDATPTGLPAGSSDPPSDAGLSQSPKVVTAIAADGSTETQTGEGSIRKASVSSTSSTKTPIKSPSDLFGGGSPDAAEVVYQYPIRSAIHIDPNKTSDSILRTPAVRSDRGDGYFPPQRYSDSRRRMSGSNSGRSRQSSRDMALSTDEDDPRSPAGPSGGRSGFHRANPPRLPPQVFHDIVAHRGGPAAGEGVTPGDTPLPSQAYSQEGSSYRSLGSTDEMGNLVTTRLKHVVDDDGHHLITGRDGKLERCEDEQIQCPGAVQGFGLIIALKEEEEGRFSVRVVSENAARMIGYTPRQLFALDNFCDILTDEQADNLLDHIDFVRDEDADLDANGPEVFTLSIRAPGKRSKKFWCALHVSEELNPGLVVCEFELEDDPDNPLAPPNENTPELPEDTLGSAPTEEEYIDSTENLSRPLRVLRSARKRKGETAAMEVFNIMSQVQEQLAIAPNLERFLKVLVGIVKELTGFHRVMIYQFDKQWNGRVVTELVDPRATKDLYKGLNFPASDIPAQARQLYKTNKVRLLYDRDQETARLVCKTAEDLERPLDLTHAYLRAMSPIHLKYLANMAVRSSMSISINAFDELWGLIACHSYGARGTRVSFPIRKMCRLVGDAASRNIERLSYASRLHARKLISTQPTQANPSGYIIASSEDLLKLFDADCGLLSIREETKILGDIQHSQEALALLEYLRMRKFNSVLSSQDIIADFPDLHYTPGFQSIAGLLMVPLSTAGQDFIVFFRKGQLKEVKWAGNPYEKFVREGTEAFLEPRKSFRTWSETVVGRCKEWTEEEIETAAVLCLVYGKFIEVWRQKEAALQNSQLTRLLLANSAHEVRTPLNAIINYLEIALEGSLDQETRDNLAKSHSASKSLIYVINDLLDLTQTEEGADLIKGEAFDLSATLKEATDPFIGDAQRKDITYEVVEHPGLPHKVLGDQRRVRQAISNITANAIQHTSAGGVKVDMYVRNWEEDRCDIEIAITDTGVGMSAKKLDALFRELEQVQTESPSFVQGNLAHDTPKTIENEPDKSKTLGLGLALVARIIKNMQGQLRLKSEEGQGTRFVIQFPFDIPDSENKEKLVDDTPQESTTPQPDASEKTLIYPAATSRRPSYELERKKSTDSAKSLKSLGSFKSGASGMSQRSDVDRMIDDISKPTVLESPRGANELHLRKPGFQRQKSSYAEPSSPKKERSRSLEGVARSPSLTKTQRERQHPGQEAVAFSGFPIKAVRMPEDVTTPPIEHPSIRSGILGEVLDEDRIKRLEAARLGPDNMRVLVAEDDPVNSRIIKKRLEKLGHDVRLTVNGAECASVYGDGYQPDCVLMDIQMPIADGMASTKMIRAHENPAHTQDPSSVRPHNPPQLSPRAQLNGRVPIIAVSASLVERERQKYIDTGFDGWILKPISFDRLNDLLKGIVDKKTRQEALFVPGQWERGGWFHMAKLLEEEEGDAGQEGTSLGYASDETQKAAGQDMDRTPRVRAAGEGKVVPPTGDKEVGVEKADFADQPVPEGQVLEESGAEGEHASKQGLSDAAQKQQLDGPPGGAEGQGKEEGTESLEVTEEDKPPIVRTPSDESQQIFQTPMSTPKVGGSFS